MAKTGKVSKTKLVPPDGGWGWVILGSALVVNFLIPGTVKSFGVLFFEFLQVFKASPTAASWMPALCYFLYSSLGNYYLFLFLHQISFPYYTGIQFKC